MLLRICFEENSSVVVIRQGTQAFAFFSFKELLCRVLSSHFLLYLLLLKFEKVYWQAFWCLKHREKAWYEFRDF